MTIQPEGAPVPPPQTPTPAPEGATEPNPTTFVLPNGSACDWAGEGATLAFDGERLDYTCDLAPEGKILGLLGSPEPTGPTEWTVVLATIGRNDADTEFVLDSREEIEFTAWSIDLRGGARCLHAGFGATLGFDGERANYTCDIIAADAMGPANGGDWVLLGDLNDVGMGQWTATRGEVVSGEDGFELVDSEDVLAYTISGYDTTAPEEATSEAADGALVGMTWQWVSTEQADGTVVEASDPGSYTLTFMDDGSVGAQFDCNSGGGAYTIEGSSLTFGPMVTTLMACPDASQADVFGQQLAEVTSYAVDGDTLTLTLADGGTMTFAAAAMDADEMDAEEAAETPEAEESISETTDPALIGATWQWTSTDMPDGTFVESLDPGSYTLTFMADGSVGVQFDCNSGGGSYTVEGSNLTFGPMMTTLMACPGTSQVDTFAQQLADVVSYALDGDTLTLTLTDGGTMTFASSEIGMGADADAGPTNDAGEADMADNSLTGTVWGWTHTEYGDDSVVEAADPNRYTLTFEGDDNVAVRLDCNRGRGTYTLDGSSLTLGPIASTRMACPVDSQVDRFAQDLEFVVSYVMDGDELALSLFADGGIMFFSPLE